MATSKITPEQFVKTWQASKSAAEVAEKLGMPYTAVWNRVSHYRAKGIKLKKMSSRRPKLNVDALNKLCT